MFKINFKKDHQGFTLVEMMVAIAVFSLVMVTAMSALLNVIDANSKARAIKTSINNISFALEGISKDMRVGTDYQCSTNGGGSYSGDCIGGGDAIRYRSIRADLEDNNTRKFAYYKFSKDDKKIYSCIQRNGIICGPSDYSPITSVEVKIESAIFYVLGVDNSTMAVPDKTQPRMILTINGVAGAQEKIQSTFDLQTTISQRLRVKTTPI